MKLAVDNGIKTIAFPCISTGVFRFPKDNACITAIKSVKGFLENNNIIEKEAFDRIHQKEVESKMQLNNEIMKLREQMKDQQNDLFNQIAFLKQETQNANQQRFEALKEIDKLILIDVKTYYSD